MFFFFSSLFCSTWSTFPLFFVVYTDHCGNKSGQRDLNSQMDRIKVQEKERERERERETAMTNAVNADALFVHGGSNQLDSIEMEKDFPLWVK